MKAPFDLTDSNKTFFKPQLFDIKDNGISLKAFNIERGLKGFPVGVYINEDSNSLAIIDESLHKAQISSSNIQRHVRHSDNTQPAASLFFGCEGFNSYIKIETYEAIRKKENFTIRCLAQLHTSSKQTIAKIVDDNTLVYELYTEDYKINFAYTPLFGEEQLIQGPIVPVGDLVALSIQVDETGFTFCVNGYESFVATEERPILRGHAKPLYVGGYPGTASPGLYIAQFHILTDSLKSTQWLVYPLYPVEDTYFVTVLETNVIGFRAIGIEVDAEGCTLGFQVSYDGGVTWKIPRNSPPWDTAIDETFGVSSTLEELNACLYEYNPTEQEDELFALKVFVHSDGLNECLVSSIKLLYSFEDKPSYLGNDAPVKYGTDVQVLKNFFSPDMLSWTDVVYETGPNLVLNNDFALWQEDGQASDWEYINRTENIRDAIEEYSEDETSTACRIYSYDDGRFSIGQKNILETGKPYLIEYDAYKHYSDHVDNGALVLEPLHLWLDMGDWGNALSTQSILLSMTTESSHHQKHFYSKGPSFAINTGLDNPDIVFDNLTIKEITADFNGNAMDISIASETKNNQILNGDFNNSLMYWQTHEIGSTYEIGPGSQKNHALEIKLGTSGAAAFTLANEGMVDTGSYLVSFYARIEKEDFEPYQMKVRLDNSLEKVDIDEPLWESDISLNEEWTQYTDIINYVGENAYLSFNTFFTLNEEGAILNYNIIKDNSIFIENVVVSKAEPYTTYEQSDFSKPLTGLRNTYFSIDGQWATGDILNGVGERSAQAALFAHNNSTTTSGLVEVVGCTVNIEDITLVGGFGKPTIDVWNTAVYPHPIVIDNYTAAEAGSVKLSLIPGDYKLKLTRENNDTYVRYMNITEDTTVTLQGVSEELNPLRRFSTNVLDLDIDDTTFASGDTPTLAVRVIDKITQLPKNLTGYTVYFAMKAAYNSVLMVDRECTITSDINGRAAILLTKEETALVGRYIAEISIEKEGEVLTVIPHFNLDIVQGLR